jgi:hypothetical protein
MSLRLPLSARAADADCLAQITWDFSKDDELWGIISGAAKTEIDCEF